MEMTGNSKEQTLFKRCSNYSALVSCSPDVLAQIITGLRSDGPFL